MYTATHTTTRYNNNCTLQYNNPNLLILARV